VSDGDVATLAGLTTLGTDAITVTITDTTVASAALVALDLLTANQITATAMTTITGTFANIKAVTVTADGASTIDTDEDYNATVSDTTINAASLTEIDVDTSGTVTATAADTITGTASAIQTAITSDGITTATDYNVTITGAATVAQLTTIDDDTTGVVTAASITDTYGNIQTLVENSPSVIENATGTITANGTFLGETISMVDVANLANLTINGAEGADTILGAQGNDTITGGTGADILFGGSGLDIFVVTDIETNGSDKLFTFTSDTDGAAVGQGDDHIQFSTADLSGVTGFAAYTGAGTTITLTGGALVEYVAGAGAAADEAGATMSFNSTNGELSFDADGTGGSATAIVVATFFSDSGSTAITDLLVADISIIA
jgi:hypothetical protein